MISKKQLKKISEFAIDIDWNKAFKGRSKGNRHLFRVVRNAKLLCKGLKVEISIVEAGAWLHDTGLAKGAFAPALAYKNEVVRFLKKIKINESDIKKVLHCIEAHDGRTKARTLESKIVHDADTLDKMGPIGIIRETWKRTSNGWTSDKIASHLRAHLRKRIKNLYTKRAKRIAKQLDKELKPFFKLLKKQFGTVRLKGN